MENLNEEMKQLKRSMTLIQMELNEIKLRYKNLRENLNAKKILNKKFDAQIFKMRNDGMLFDEIAHEFGLSNSEARKGYSRQKYKQQRILLKYVLGYKV